MKYEELSRALEFLDEDLLLEADAARTVIRGGGKHRRWKQFLKQPRSWISAACILLSVSLLAVTLLLGSMYGFYLGPLEIPNGESQTGEQNSGNQESNFNANSVIWLQVNQENNCFEILYPDGSKESYLIEEIKFIHHYRYDMYGVLDSADPEMFFLTFFSEPLKLILTNQSISGSRLEFYFNDRTSINCFYRTNEGYLWFETVSGEKYVSLEDRFSAENMNSIFYKGSPK